MKVKIVRWNVTVGALVAGFAAFAAFGLLASGASVSASTIASVFSHADDPSLAGLGAAGVLALGLVFGLKHATEADHVVAVSTIVSEHRQIRRAAMVGALWGVGHTASLVGVGVFVLTLKVAVSEVVAGWLEFGVALMIIGLGAGALVRGVRGRSTVHVHRHEHDGSTHAHLHFHEQDGSREASASHDHSVVSIGLKPIVVGAVHGLAGSAALTLLVLTQIESVVLGLVYLLVFGLGSVAGMLTMSGLIGLPFALSTSEVSRNHHLLQIAAGAFSILFGCWYAFRSSAELVGAASLLHTVVY